MAIQVVVPNLGESIVEATVTHWEKKVGDTVQVGETLVELETDKVNLEVGAEQAGVLVQVLRAEGDDVRVGDVLAEIQPANESAPTPAAEADVSRAAGAHQAKIDDQPQVRDITPPMSPSQVSTREPDNGDDKATPLARRVAQMHGLDPAQIPGSGSGGRVNRDDVERFLSTPAPEIESKPETMPPASSRPEQRQDGIRGEERIRLSRRRKTIAQHLVDALRNTAMLTTFNDVDMQAVMDLRARHKPAFKDKYGVSLGIMSFFVKASVAALRDFPQVNSELEGDDLIVKQYYDIGIAIGAEEGLVVPVLRDADRMSFPEIETAIQSFAQRSREGKLSIDDLRGGTFSITNGGVYGSLMSTPILNYPQVAILGLHRIEDRAIVRDGMVQVRPMMYLALSYDHRVIDGREAVQFVNRIKQLITDPEMLFFDL